jgi:plasmid stabilization system protein ParE
VAKFVVLISDEAKTDLQKAREYYNNIADVLTARFNTDIEFTIKSLKSNPYNYQKRYMTVRIAFAKFFPFGIHFII